MEMMGIINVTPDSFYEGSRVSSVEDAFARAEAMIREGASMIDVGGESTRPGASSVTEEEEIQRVAPVISRLKKVYPHILVSVDTYHVKTAQAALEAGADILNDISGLTFEPEMADLAAETGAPVILMHINGRPDHMQDNPVYENVVEEVYEFFQRQIAFAMSRGVARDRIIIDLGIGFGKTCEHNIELLKNIRRFDELKLPHLLAVSRKSMIGAVLDKKNPAHRLHGTTALTAYAAWNEIEIARVHDVGPNLDAARMVEALR